jgi:hypothetical protein
LFIVKLFEGIVIVFVLIIPFAVILLKVLVFPVKVFSKLNKVVPCTALSTVVGRQSVMNYSKKSLLTAMVVFIRLRCTSLLHRRTLRRPPIPRIHRIIHLKILKLCLWGMGGLLLCGLGGLECCCVEWAA